MAFQKSFKEKKFLTVRNGYHGDTMGTMSVSDPTNGMHSIFEKSLLKQYYVSCPEDIRTYKRKQAKSPNKWKICAKKIIQI